MDYTQSGSWSDTYNELKKHHNEAYHVIEKAIGKEEEGRFEEAIGLYEAGLVALDRGLSIVIECPTNPDITWERACAMTQKMKKTRKEVLSRIAGAHVNHNMSSAPPPTYEEATSGTATPVNSSSIQTYRELGETLQTMKVETGAQSATVIYSHDGVRIYFINPNGDVMSAMEPETLYIGLLEDGGEGDKPRIYLQVGHWIYPLVPGVSPCFRTEYGAFILPDVHSAVEGSAVGIMLPSDADISVHELLIDILCSIIEKPPLEEPHAGRQRRDVGYRQAFPQSLVRGAQNLSAAIVRGAETAGEYMNVGTPKLISKISPQQNPATINPKVSKGIKVAKDVTGKAVVVTGYIAHRVYDATAAVGRFIAPHIQKQGARLLTTTCNMSEQDATRKVDNVLEVAAGAAESFGTVYEGLERSAGILATNLANNTVKVVEHKYGCEAGAATGDTLQVVGNVFVAGHSAKMFLTPKGLAKKTVTGAGRGILENYRASLQNENQTLQSQPGTSVKADTKQ